MKDRSVHHDGVAGIPEGKLPTLVPKSPPIQDGQIRVTKELQEPALYSPSFVSWLSLGRVWSGDSSMSQAHILTRMPLQQSMEVAVFALLLPQIKTYATKLWDYKPSCSKFVHVSGSYNAYIRPLLGV